MSRYVAWITRGLFNVKTAVRQRDCGREAPFASVAACAP